MFLKRVAKISSKLSSPEHLDTNGCAICSSLHRPLQLIKVEWNRRLDTISRAAVSIRIGPYTLGESVRSPGGPVAPGALIPMYGYKW